MTEACDVCHKQLPTIELPFMKDGSMVANVCHQCAVDFVKLSLNDEDAAGKISHKLLIRKRLLDNKDNIRDNPMCKLLLETVQDFVLTSIEGLPGAYNDIEVGKIQAYCAVNHKIVEILEGMEK